MLKLNSILAIIFSLILATSNAQSIDATKFCEQINAIASTWTKSNFKDCQGAVVSTNTQLNTVLYKNNKEVSGAIKNEVLCYKNESSLNSVRIIFYQSEVVDETTSLNFKKVFDVLKACLKTYKMEQNAGTTTGKKDEDDDLPDFDFSKAGAPNINISIEEPILDKTFKVVITMDEPEGE